MKKLPPVSEEVLQQLSTNRTLRKAYTSQNLSWFFHMYFGHYIKYKTADFQFEMMDLASDPTIEQLIIEGFRGCGKSTLITTVLPLWAAIGILGKKYIMMVSQTQNQSQQHLANLSHELVNNPLIRKDFWPYDFEENELGVSAINLPKYGAKIIAVSREQGTRGLRSAENRPDLVIVDDVEDTKNIKNQKSRDANYSWLTGELIPGGTEETKFVIVGTMLHEDAMLERLKEDIRNGKRDGVYKSYPIDREGVPLWPGRFPNQDAIKKLERRIADPVRFEREYRLNLVPDERQIITRDMIHTYSAQPPRIRGQRQFVAIGVDPAISEKDASDCCAMITLDIRGSGKDVKFYVLPNPVNAHYGFPETMDLIRELNAVNFGPAFYVESVAYQMAITQSALLENIDARPVNLQMDKRVRLNMIASHIRDGTILFPETGFEEGINQLIGFGVERYKDLVDALTIVVIGYLREEQDKKRDSVWIVPGSRPPRYYA